MNNVKNPKGMTMISLVVTIIILVILSSMVTHTGMSSIKNSRFNRLKNELELVQANVNVWYEKYIDYTFEEIPIGSEISGDKKVQLEENLKKVDNVSQKVERYRYFTIEQFKDLQIEGIENEYFIDVKNQVAILAEGYEYDGKIYYMLDDVKTVTRGGKNIEEIQKINLNSIKIESDSIELNQNTTAEITIILNPVNTTEKLKYISEDDNYVSIKNVQQLGDGKIILTIKGNKVGKTTITIINEKRTISVSCDVTVKK